VIATAKGGARGDGRPAGDVENLGCGGNDLLWGFYAVD